MEAAEMVKLRSGGNDGRILKAELAGSAQELEKVWNYPRSVSGWELGEQNAGLYLGVQTRDPHPPEPQTEGS